MDSKRFSGPYTRRKLITWAGQIAAGASLAAIGLGIGKPLTALASSAEPKCTPCPSKGTCAEVTYCSGNPPCNEHLRYNKTVTYYLGGCITHGQCPTNTCSGCAGGCDCTCPPY
jgi:hypothetical protein